MTTNLSIGSRYARKGDPGQFRTLPWLEAVLDYHDDDAHSVCYESDRRLGTGDEHLVECNVVFLDYDESDDHPDILERLLEIPDGAASGQWAVAYPTKSGMRIVYVLDRPVPAVQFALLVKALAMDLWKHANLRIDPTSEEWSRMFRLPHTIRTDGKADGPTWQQGYYFAPLARPEVRLMIGQLAPFMGRLPWDKRGAKGESAGSQPGFDDALPIDRGKIYKHTFTRHRYRTYLLDDGMPPEGRRDQTLLHLSGEVAKVAFQAIPDASAEEIYLFLRPIADRLEPDGSESWHAKLWRMVSHSWGQEVRKETERREREAIEVSQRDALFEAMLTQVPGNEIPNDPAERRLFARRHLCLQTSTGAYVVQRDGSYSLQPLKTSQLPAHFHDNLTFLDDNGFRNESGKMMSGQDILNEFSTIVSDVEYVAGDRAHSRLRIHGHRRVLEVVPFALRADLAATAEFDKEVGAWLDSFDNAEMLKRWLASALALNQGPTCALYLHGPARVGKSLLCQALAECFDSQPVPGAQAFSDFNGALLNSPVVMVDEGLPTRITGMDTSDLFRTLITGGPVSVQKKYQDQSNSRVPYRLLFAANSYDMVKHLVGRRTMEATDRDAFRERILVLETGQRPALYLDSKGAMNFTRFSSKGSWLGGECRLARHLIRLYQIYFEEQQFVRDGRMLVEGKDHPAFMLAFDLGGAGQDVVDEIVIDIGRCLENKIHDRQLKTAMKVENGRVWIKKRPYVKILTQRIPKLHGNAANGALDRFSTGRAKADQDDLATLIEIDADRLYYIAKAIGLGTANLERLRLERAGLAQ